MHTHTRMQINIEQDNIFLSAFLNSIFDDLLRIEQKTISPAFQLVLLEISPVALASAGKKNVERVF